MIEKVITANIIRTLQKIKRDPSQHLLDLLVEDMYHDDLMELLGKDPEGNDADE